MPLKISVVIPVYNPGKYLDPCVDSLLRQTLPADEFEVLFVDDGSTDDTPARLDELAEKHPNWRVIHIPNSGWPGKPRNVGVDEARGEYVQFVDQDDYLASEALHRLYEMGHRNSSDIVIGKVASNFRGVPHGVFKTDRDACTIYDAPLYDSLTPHKMFRTEFLRDNKIAYPEGKRRLEDQLYMMQAYFPAKVVSILGTYTCYFYSKRDDGQNAGSVRIVPAGYYGNLREVLDVVMANTEPGEFRDRLLRRFYRVEMLGRLSEPAVLKYDETFLGEVMHEVSTLATEYIGDGVHNGLGAVQRLRSTALRANDRAALLRVAELAASVKPASRLEEGNWEPDGRFRVGVSARLVVGEDKKPLELVRRDDRYYLAPELTEGLLSDGELLDITDDLDSFAAELAMRNRESAVEWSCPATFTREITPGTGERCEVVLRGSGYVPTEGVKGRGRVSRGMWDIWVPVRGLGVVRKARLGADRAATVDEQCLPAMLGKKPRLVAPYFTDPHGNLTFDVDRKGKTLVGQLAGRTNHRITGVPEVRLAVFASSKTGSAGVEVELSSGEQRHRVTGRLVPVGERMHLRLPERVPAVPRGEFELTALLDGPERDGIVLGPITVDGKGRLTVASQLPVDQEISRLLAAERKQANRYRLIRTIGRPVARLLPSAARQRLRRLAGARPAG